MDIQGQGMWATIGFVVKAIWAVLVSVSLYVLGQEIKQVKLDREEDEDASDEMRKSVEEVRQRVAVLDTRLDNMGVTLSDWVTESREGRERILDRIDGLAPKPRRRK